jgi:AcrR family transcriptional regulator
MPIRNGDARRERAREHARRDILLAAADVFARRGYAAATLAELAEAAGYAAPSLYRYFASKEEIFRSLVDLVVREFGATFDEPVDPGLPLVARLEGLLGAQRRVADAIRPALAMLMGAGAELCEVSPHLRSQDAGMDFYEARLLAWLRRHASAAELRHPPEVVARALTGLVFAFRRGDRGAPPDRNPAALILDLAFHGFAAPAPRRRGATP